MSNYVEEKKLLVVAMENSKRRGIFFSVMAVSKIFVAIAVQLIFILINKAESSAYAYTQYVLGGATVIAVIAAMTRAYNLKFVESVRLNKTGAKYYLLALLLFVGMVFGLSSLNGYFISFLEKFGYKYTEPPLPEFSALNYILVSLTICILPAVYEEFAFRGFIVGGLGGAGKIPVALVTAFLFSIYHSSPAQTVYQFAVGFCFALLAIESGSVIPTMIVHFMNNFLIVNAYYFWGGGVDFGTVGNIIATVIGVASIVVFLVLTLKGKKGEKAENGTFASKWFILRSFIFAALIGTIAYLALWIINLLNV